VLICASRYNCSANDLIYGSRSHIINLHVIRVIGDDTLSCATFLRELIMIRDGFLDLSDGLDSMELSIDEVLWTTPLSYGSMRFLDPRRTV
jgi:hypothetical protein